MNAGMSRNWAPSRKQDANVPGPQVRGAEYALHRCVHILYTDEYVVLDAGEIVASRTAARLGTVAPGPKAADRT